LSGKILNIGLDGFAWACGGRLTPERFVSVTSQGIMILGSHLFARLSAFGKPWSGKSSGRLQAAASAAIEGLEDRTLFTALYWDPSGAATATGGAGTWDTITAQWRSGSPTGPLVAWNNSTNNDAIFPASSGEVTLGTAISAKSLTFKTGGYLVDGNPLTFAGGNGRVDVIAGGTATIASAITGKTALTKVDSGMLILTAANSFSGTTTISGGKLLIENPNALQNSVASIGTANGLTFAGQVGLFNIAGLAGGKNLSLANTNNGAISLVISGTATNSTYSGILSGAGSLRINTGTETLSGANTYTGGTTLFSGQLNINNASAIGTGLFSIYGGTIDDTAAPIKLKTNNAQQWGADFSYGGSYALNLGGGPVTLTSSRTVTTTAKMLTVGGVISDSGSGYGLTKAGAGTLLLTGASTFRGPTSINAGVLQLGTKFAVQNSTVVLNHANGLRFNSGIGGVTLGGLSGNVAEVLADTSAHAIMLSIGNNGSSNIYTGVLSGSGSLDLIGGVLAITANNTYSGGTRIDAGVLLANVASGSATGLGPVTVNSGGTFGGAGVITGAVTVNSGGTLAPGAGQPGILNTGNLTLASGSNLQLTLNGDVVGSGYDQINVNGAATITGSRLILTGTKTTEDGASLDIINTSSAFIGTLQSQTTAYNGVTYSANYTTSGKQHQVFLNADTAASSTSTGSSPPPVQSVPTAPTSPIPPTTPTPTPVVPSPFAPKTPLNPIVSAPSTSEVDVTWAAVNGASGYFVQRSLNGSTGWSTIGTPVGDFWADMGQSPSATLYYRIAASNAVGTSAYSAIVSTVALSSTAITPSISGNVTASDGVSYSLNLSAPTANRYPVNAPVQSWSVNWGDGTAAMPDIMMVPGKIISANHTYLTNGPETITAVATNGFGQYTVTPLSIVVVNPPSVTGFQVNDGSAQRSMVNSLAVNFDQPVALSSSAFQLTQTGALSTAPMGFQLVSTNGGMSYVLSFPQAFYSMDVGDSLPDGTYDLGVNAGSAGMQHDVHFKFDRLLGDVDGSGVVFQPNVSLNSVSPGTVGTPITISATAKPFGVNGDTLSYEWFLTGPSGTFTLAGGNVTSEDNVTFVPDVAGTWTASVVVTDTDLSVSTGTSSQSFNVASNTTPQSLTASFGSSGLNGLSYAGATLVGAGASGSDPGIGASAMVIDANGNAVTETNTASWNAANLTETYTAPDYVVTIQYDVGLNSLGFNINAQNISPNQNTIQGFRFTLIYQLKFPKIPTGFNPGGPSVAFDTVSPSFVNADYGTATVVIGVQQQTPGYIGFFSSNATAASDAYTAYFATDTAGSLPTSWPVLHSAIAPGESATYNTFLRFGPTGAGPALSADINQAFATANPFQMQWDDRRPITELYPTNQQAVSAINPQGFFGDPALNTVSATNLSAFSHEMLTYASGQISNMLAMGSQGMVAWDLEGWALQGWQSGTGSTTYVGDPSLVTTLAPEWATTDGVDAGYSNLLDEFFAKFRDVGLKVGMTLRPTQIEFVNGQAWQEPVSDPAQLLISKIEYAKQQWGASLFYIDSTWSGGISLSDIAGVLAKVHAAEPDVLLIPEQDTVAGLPYGAPYAEMVNRTQIPGTDAITPAAYRAVYADAFSVIRSDKSRTVVTADLPALTEGIASGDTYFIQNIETPVKAAFDAVALQDGYAGVNNSNDTFVLRLSTPANTADAQYQVLRDGLLIDSFAVSSTPSLSFHFAGSHDNLVIDTTGGNPVPTGGITFDGINAANGDSLSVVGPLSNQVINVNGTQMKLANLAINYFHLAQVSIDPTGVGTLITGNAGLVATPSIQASGVSIVLASAGAPAPTPGVYTLLSDSNNTLNGWYVGASGVDNSHPRTLADLLQL
jgi:autotransporter-associated beta strand protein